MKTCFALYTISIGVEKQIQLDEICYLFFRHKPWAIQIDFKRSRTKTLNTFFVVVVLVFFVCLQSVYIFNVTNTIYRELRIYKAWFMLHIYLSLIVICIWNVHWAEFGETVFLLCWADGQLNFWGWATKCVGSSYINDVQGNLRRWLNVVLASIYIRVMCKVWRNWGWLSRHCWYTHLFSVYAHKS